MMPGYPRACAIVAGVFVLTSSTTGQTPGTAYEVIQSMQAAQWVGGGPVAPLLEGSDGALYGSTRLSGTNPGTIFKINKDGTSYRVLHVFAATLQDGGWPFAQLIKGSDGLLYGTAEIGGAANAGTLFRIGEDGRNFKILRHFAPGTGAAPRGALLIGDDGGFYSTTASGGTSNSGVIYKINQDGTGYRVLHNFRMNVSDGRVPEAGMIRGSDGRFYGVAHYGGTHDDGTVFGINQDGTGYSIVRNFNESTPGGKRPESGGL